jgi:hypothetical protein
VTIELDNSEALGKTTWQPGEGPHEVARTVDAARFFEHYFDTVA